MLRCCRSRWHASAAVWAAIATLTLACNSDPTGPSTLDRVGPWHLSYTVSGEGIACSGTDIDLYFAPPGSLPPNGIGGGQATCTGRGLNLTGLVMGGSVLDSLTIGSGRITFSTHANAYHYDGRIVSADSLRGTLTSDLYYTNVGPVHQSGTWTAHRVATP
jgi:hypothetical protein